MALLPLVPVLLLAALTLLPRVGGDPVLTWSFLGASGGVLLLWAAVRRWGRRGRLTIEIALRPQHYLQALAHTAILVYWGLYWDPIRDAAWLIVAQIVFAYAFDMALVWSRRATYTLGFGPFPIVFSTNLFLRFHDDWFFLQFVLIAVGFLAKELITWERDGRRTHIFNPSSFPLALASLLLIVTGTTGITWGEQIASELFLPPQIFLFIFLVSLPSQYLFGVTTMTLSAVVTTYGLGVAYFALTGTYLFVDAYIPIAVFLGMHLLFTDPSTSPRTELGRIVFGMLYGASVVGLYILFLWAGVPTFYDKLLQVPILNLLVRVIDRAARSPAAAWCDPARWGRSLAPARRRLAYTGVWAVVFAAMSSANVVGDHHPGHSVPFWEQACREARPRGCEVLGIIETRYCAAGSGWACNEVGLLMAEGKLEDSTHAAQAFTFACRLGLTAGCQNQEALAAGRPLGREPPPYRDYAILLRTGKGPIPILPPAEMYARACELGWRDACAMAAR